MPDHAPTSWHQVSLSQFVYTVWAEMQTPDDAPGPALPPWEHLPEGWRATWTAWLGTGGEIGLPREPRP